jgi:hypothetical protein
VRLFWPDAGDHSGEVAALHLPNTAVAQVATTPNQIGFVIRVWAPGHLHEYGGHNITCAHLVLAFDAEGKPIVLHVEAGDR